MVTVNINEVDGACPNCVWPDAPTTYSGVEEQVDRGMTELWVVLVGRQDRPNKLAVGLDGVDALVRIGSQELALDPGGVVAGPPARNLGRREDSAELWDVAVSDRSEHYTATDDGWRLCSAHAIFALSDTDSTGGITVVALTARNR